MIRVARFYRVLAAFLLAIGLLISSGLNPAASAFAKSLTPEAEHYQIDATDASYGLSAKALRDDARNSDSNEYLFSKSVQQKATDTAGEGKNKLEEAIDTVVEKLNLNEPLPESTQEFLQDVEEKVEETVSPITGDNSGFYKGDR
jgi:hypothetical protein